MAAEVIQADYEKLAEVAQRFSRCAEAAEHLRAEVSKSFEVLHGGDWRGMGAEAFSAEMTGEVFPALQRFIAALQAGSDVTLRISQVVQQAEEEAANIWRDWTLDGAGSQAGAGGQMQAGGPGGMPAANVAGGQPQADGVTSGQPPRTMQELAARINDLYQGNTPVRLVKIGSNDYLVMLAGTEVGDGNNNWGSAIQSGLGMPSSYERQVRDIIAQNIPPGANVHMAGHSLGGIVANNLADNQDFLDSYNVQSVTTFGAPVSAHENPSVQYSRFADISDPVPYMTRDLIKGELPGSTQRIVETGQQLIAAHGAYKDTPALAGVDVPFTTREWNDSFTGNGPALFPVREMDGASLVVDNILSGEPGRIASGAINALPELARQGSLSVMQYGVGELTSGVSPALRNGIDRYADRFFERASSGNVMPVVGPAGNIAVAGVQTAGDLIGDGLDSAGDFFSGLFR